MAKHGGKVENMALKAEAHRLFVEVMDKYQISPRTGGVRVSELVDIFTEWFIYVATPANERRE